MKILHFIPVGALMLLIVIPFDASGQLNLWSVDSFEDFTREVNSDSSAYFYYEDGLPFNHLYTVHFGREDEVADEVYHISSKFFPSIESSASMTFLLYRPYALTATSLESFYEGKLSEWIGYKKLGIGESLVLSTAIKDNRMAELSILKKQDGVDWFVIVTNVEDSIDKETFIAFN